MICPACQEDIHPIDEMGDDMRVVSKCPKIGCGAALPKLDAVLPSKSTIVSKPSTAPAIATYDEDANLLDMVKSRRESIAKRIVELRAQEVELAMLDRMILAAESDQ